METLTAGNGIDISLVRTPKFKTVTVCALPRRPLSRGEVTVNALIPGILKRGSLKYNNLFQINEQLEIMYGRPERFDAARGL